MDDLMDALVEAMTGPVEPCCPDFGRTLHHHWRVPPSEVGAGVLMIPETVDFDRG